MTDICTGQKIITVHLTYLSQETNHCLLSRLHWKIITVEDWEIAIQSWNTLLMLIMVSAVTFWSHHVITSGKRNIDVRRGQIMAVVKSYRVKEWLRKRKLKFYYSSVCMCTMIGWFSRPWFTVPPTKTQIKVSWYWNLPLYVNPEI